MATLARIVAGATVIACVSAPSFAQKVTYDYHRGQDFAELRTYSFKDAPPSDAEAHDTTAYDSPIVRQNTDAAVASQLEGRGMVRDDQNPDVFITTRRAFETKQIVYGSPGWGYGWGYWGYGPWYSYEEIMGTLTVDVVNARTGELVWRGVGEREMHPMSSPEKRLKRINREVTKIFRNYPATVATSGRAKPKATGN